MSTRALLISLFAYKAEANRELLDALAELGAPSSSAYSSALRVLNHAHSVDRIFAANLEGRSHDFAATWSDTPPPLPALAASIRETDQWYEAYVAGLDTSALEQVVDFTFTDGGHGRMSREEMLAHVITHSGYHRGEVGRLMPETEAAGMRDIFTGYLHRSDPSRRAPLDRADAG